jgi:type II secretory pathway predicted ATPase ExeA
MINQFWGLREQPFGVTPDPRYLYLGPGHRETLASLFYGIEANRGFLALIAQPGMGKTTLLFHLLEKFRHSARTAFLFQTQCSSRELLRFLLAEFGIESKENDLVGMHEQFNRYLLEQSAAGNRVIVVIDEAHNLKPSALETLRLLSDFETPRAKLLQIILAGQPELATKLASPSRSQLRQRIASFNRLEPLAPLEVAQFIDHRLHVAGYQGPPLFSDKAKAMIAGLSEGIPRNINSLCFGALSLACALRKKTIDTEIVDEVFGDLDLQRLIPHPQRAAPLHRSTNWSPQVAHSEVASLSQTPPSPTETRPMPTGDGALSGTPSDLDGADHDVGIRNAPLRLIIRERMASHSLPRVVGLLVVLVLMVGSGTTRLTAPAVEIANIRPLSHPENVALSSIFKIPDTEAVKLPPGKTQPKQVHPSVDPTELWRGFKEGSTSAKVRHVDPVFEIADTWLLPNPENVAPPSRVRISDTEAVSLAPTDTQPEHVQNPTMDPSGLWKRVQEGSTSAEIRLATLYLDQSGVQQNCEQAHLLLVAASRHGSKVADDLLNGRYAERCQ